MLALVERLAAAGCVAPNEEAAELLAAAAGSRGALAGLVARRERGEPLAWLTGSVRFAGLTVRVDPGVYVPRHQTERLAQRAAELLGPDGTAVDLCTGSGAVAVVLAAAQPGARVLATDIDEAACRCARSNGIEAFVGSLAEPLPTGVAATVDVVTAVVPYVPSREMAFLPRDVRDHEPAVALDGGIDGLAVLRRAVDAAASLLRPAGWLLLELGADQDRILAPVLSAAGFEPAERLVDADGDLRAIVTRRAPG